MKIGIEKLPGDVGDLAEVPDSVSGRGGNGRVEDVERLGANQCGEESNSDGRFHGG
jgi:hypothetical protein